MRVREVYDVIVIGGGVVGCAVARELGRYRLKTALLEKNLDVGYETSGRNTGVCHGGFAYDVGTWKAKLCLEGNRMMGEVAEELDFPFKRCGKVLVGKTEADYNRLLEVIEQGHKIGVTGLSMITDEELHRLIPGVVGNFAMLSATSGILDPFKMTIALAENAAENGAKFFFGREVTGIARRDGLYEIEAGGEVFATRWVVNSAGLSCGKISDMLGLTGYRVIYSKDDYILLDPRLGKEVPMPIYTVPSNTYMGIHVTVTTDGNLLLGPTAEDSENNSYYGVEQKNIDFLYQAAMKPIPLTICAATRPGSPTPPKPCWETSIICAEPSATRRCVRVPATFARNSRSAPINPPSTPASTSRMTISGVSTILRPPNHYYAIPNWQLFGISHVFCNHVKFYNIMPHLRCHDTLDRTHIHRTLSHPSCGCGEPCARRSTDTLAHPLQ